MIWIIDLVAVAVSVLPPVVRNYIHTVWVKALLTPLNQTNAEFADFAQSTIRQVAATGQVVELEYTLNSNFDPMHSRIFITDGDWLGLPPSIFLRIEQQTPIYLYRNVEIPPASAMILYKQAEYFSDTDFIVHAPIAIADESRMRGIIDGYRVAGKRYEFLFF